MLSGSWDKDKERKMGVGHASGGVRSVLAEKENYERKMIAHIFVCRTRN